MLYKKYFLIFLFIISATHLLALRQEYHCYPLTYTLITTTTTSSGGTMTTTEYIQTDECAFVWIEGEEPPGGCEYAFEESFFVQLPPQLQRENQLVDVVILGDFNADGQVDDHESVNLSEYGFDDRWFFQTIGQTHFKAIQLQHGPLPGGLLILDLDGDGIFSHAREMLGNQFDENNLPALNAATALRTYDQPNRGGNTNGIIDPADYYWEDLYFWQDKNGDGISQPEEMHTLTTLGISQLDPFPKSLRTKRGYQIMITLNSGQQIPAFLL